jgi:hypothetical protein
LKENNDLIKDIAHRNRKLFHCIFIITQTKSAIIVDVNKVERMLTKKHKNMKITSDVFN